MEVTIHYLSKKVSKIKKETYQIKGMSCAACSSTIESVLSKTNGVITVNVQLLTEKMSIEFDENVINENKIFSIVEGLGYQALTIEDKNQEVKIKNINLFKNFYISLFFLVPLLYLSMGHMIKLPFPTIGSPNITILIKTILELLLSIVIMIINRHFYFSGIKKIFKLHPNMDSLVSIGSLSSFFYSLVLTILIIINLNSNDLITYYFKNLFYESATMILVLVSLGKALENKAKKKTSKEIEKLSNLIPDTANLIINDEIKIVKVSDISVNDIILVRPDEYIPVDGIVIEGHSYLDKKAITGESMPVLVNEFDYVTSACINKMGSLKIQVKKVKEDTTIAKIIKMVKEAGNSKAPIEKLADKISLYFVPIVCLISIITFIVWMIIGKGDFPTAINYAISVLVISCPCALGLATPMAIMVGTGVGARIGILYKDATTIERVSSVDTVLFDKTGTLTKGEPTVQEIIPLESSYDEVLTLAYSIELHSNHPLAKSICELSNKVNIERAKTHQNQLLPLKVNDFKYHIGLGATGIINDDIIVVGNQKLLNNYQIKYDEKTITDLENKYAGKMLFYVGCKNLIGVIILADEVKDNAPLLIKNLKSHHYEPIMITGDQERVAKTIAYELGISKYYADVLPEDKLRLVKENKTNHVVAFIGDGINDTPAIKEADIGIAISKINDSDLSNQNFDVALESASIVIASQDINTVNTMFVLSKKIVNNIKGNLFWAFFYNVIGISIASGIFAFANFTLNPMIAATAMSLSSLFVATNALRLNTFKMKKENQKMEKTVYIEGMMCKHCQARVEKALSEIPDVTKVEVNLKKKLAIITSTTEISDEKIKDQVEKAGYEIKK